MIKIATGIYQHGKSILDTKQLELTLMEIKNSIYITYFDRSSAHFASAIASLDAAKESSSPINEFRAAIHHLYDAFFAVYELLDKKVEKTTILGDKYYDEMVKYKEDIYIPCCKISALLYSLYYFINEKDNAEIWKKYMLEMYKNAKPLLQFGNEKHEIEKELYVNLKRRNTDYVSRRLGYDWGDGTGPYSQSSGRGCPVIRHYITKVGCNYGTDIIKDLDNRIDCALNNKYPFQTL